MLSPVRSEIQCRSGGRVVKALGGILLPVKSASRPDLKLTCRRAVSVISPSRSFPNHNALASILPAGFALLDPCCTSKLTACGLQLLTSVGGSFNQTSRASCSRGREEDGEERTVGLVSVLPPSSSNARAPSVVGGPAGAGCGVGVDSLDAWRRFAVAAGPSSRGLGPPCQGPFACLNYQPWPLPYLLLAAIPKWCPGLMDLDPFCSPVPHIPNVVFKCAPW